MTRLLRIISLDSVSSVTKNPPRQTLLQVWVVGPILKNFMAVAQRQNSYL